MSNATTALEHAERELIAEGHRYFRSNDGSGLQGPGLVQRLTVALERRLNAEPAAEKSLFYGPSVRNGVHTAKPDNFTDAQWHQSASADTGYSHNLPGRLYIVQCEWCPKAFAAHTKAEAMELFRAHELEMQETEDDAVPAEPPVRELHAYSAERIAELIGEHDWYELTSSCLCGEHPPGKDMNAHRAEVILAYLAEQNGTER